MPSAELEELEIHPLFKAVFAESSGKINDIAEDDNSRLFFKSLLTGGYTTANAMVNLCDGIKKAWGEGDKSKALALTKLGTLLLLSQTFRWIEDQHTEKNGASATNLSVVSKTLSLFDDDSEAAIKDFLELDLQFKYETGHKSDMTHFRVYLMAKACEACDHKCMDWEKISFPIKSLEPLTRSGAILDSVMVGDLRDIRAMLACHSIGIQVMTKYHEEHNKS
ncbi:MAG: hypothetical protein ABH934_03100 [Chloroflexota bacterium]